MIRDRAPAQGLIVHHHPGDGAVLRNIDVVEFLFDSLFARDEQLSEPGIAAIAYAAEIDVRGIIDLLFLFAVHHYRKENIVIENQSG